MLQRLARLTSRMANRNSLFTIEDRFATELRDALRQRYGKIPPAAFITTEFNRRLTSKNGVSQECMRRWLRGLSMPSYFHFQTLSLWLGLNANRSLGIEVQDNCVRYTETIMQLAEVISRMPVTTQVPLLDLISSLNSLRSKSPSGSHEKQNLARESFKPGF